MTNWVIVALLIRVSDSARAPQPDDADTGTLAPVKEGPRDPAALPGGTHVIPPYPSKGTT